MINTNDITEDESAQLCVHVTELGFPPDILASLIDTLQVCNSKRNGFRSNIALQSWEAFPDYLPRSRWNEIRDAINSLEALKMIVVDTIRLGLRHPSCPTFAMLSSLHTIKAIVAEQAVNLTRKKNIRN